MVFASSIIVTSLSPSSLTETIPHTQIIHTTINSSRPEHTKRTQGNAEQHKATHAGQAEPTQPKQHQQTKNQHRGSRTLLETTNDRKPKPTHQPQAAPIETTTQGLPQPHRPSQPNLPRTTLDPTRHPRQHRTRTSNVQAPHGITPCGVCAGLDIDRRTLHHVRLSMSCVCG